MRYIMFFAIILFFVNCGNRNEENKNIETDIQVFEYKNERHVSIINLIATPDEYDKKRISIEGFLNLEFENCAIYLNETDCLRNIDKNSIWIEISRDSLKKFSSMNKTYVQLEGMFNMNNKGFESAYSGSIDSIIRIKPLP